MKRYSILIAILLVVNAIGTMGQMRPRPVIQNRTLVSGDNFKPLRGTAMNICSDALPYEYDVATYINCRDQLNMNCLRIVNFQAWVITHQADNKYEWDFNTILTKLDVAINAAETAGMYVILNYHDYPFDDGAGGYTEAERWQMCKDFWASAALRYANKTHVIFELTNEPYMDLVKLVNNLYRIQEVYNIARTAAPNTPFILVTPWTPGNMPDVNGSRTLRQMADACTWADWSKDVLGWHCYPGERYAWEGDFEASITDFKNNSTKPWYCTEYGDNESDDWNSTLSNSYYGYQLETQGLELNCNIGWCDWWAGRTSDANFKKYGVNRLKADAVAKGYFWAADKAVISGTTAIETESTAKMGLNIYPNPVVVGEKLTIAIKDAKNMKEGNVSIFDTQGRKVYKSAIISNEFNVNTSSFTSGVYFVKLNSQNEVITKKMIVR